MSKPIQLMIFWTTVATREDARTLARRLVESRLAACVQIDGPVESFYEWDGDVCDESEYRLWIKSTRGRKEELEATVKDIHPYELPQWIAVDVDHAGEGYADWAEKQVTIR
ncbi:MAG: divalent-cation tolerance protein CutA [Planctomycetota bacterium]